MRNIVLASMMALAASHNAQAQSWAGEGRTFFQARLKALPPGFSHFQQLPSDLRLVVRPNERIVLCREMANAISFGKQLALGASDSEAIEAIRNAWRGDIPCGYVPGVQLTAREFAVRGDDRGRRIVVVKLTDRDGNAYYAGWPMDGRSG